MSFNSMAFLIFVCFASFLWLLWLLRRNRVSLGLPIAYLYSLLLIHAPGVYAHIVGRDFLHYSDLIEIGMRFAALGSVCFVAGVWWSRFHSSFAMMRMTPVPTPE